MEQPKNDAEPHAVRHSARVAYLRVEALTLPASPNPNPSPNSNTNTSFLPSDYVAAYHPLRRARAPAALTTQLAAAARVPDQIPLRAREGTPNVLRTRDCARRATARCLPACRRRNAQG